VLLSEPQKSPYDFSFNAFGFPVRVHPGFFILPLVFGAGSAGSGGNPGVIVLIYCMVLFASILVHELGHAIAFRIYGVRSRVVLYWMGGLAIPETSGWGAQPQLTPRQKIIVSVAGPLAGFVLAALLVGIVFAVGGKLAFGWMGMFPMVIPDLNATSLAGNMPLAILFGAGLFFNLIWGAVNLVPVYPMDGGQVARELCTLADYQNGLRNSLVISVVVAAILAFLGFATRSQFVGILFAVLGVQSWMTLQQMFGRGRGRW